MFAQLSRWLMIAALLGVLGAHWAVLQSVAWATMLADHARSERLPVAIVNTFDGKHPCALCKQINADKQTERKGELQTEFKKLEFLHPAAVMALAAPSHFRLVPEPSFSALVLAETPPVPPPRALPA